MKNEKKKALLGNAMKTVGVITTIALVFVFLWSQKPVEKSKMTKEQRKEYRAEERAKRNAEATKAIDSIVLSRNWQFVPSTMQQMAGPTRMIYRNYYINVFPTYVQVYIPYIRGIVNQYITLMNFDIMSPQNYEIVKTNDGWNVSFQGNDFTGNFYTFDFNIYTPSYEVVLNITSIRFNTVTYNGTLMGW